jgi:type IV secretion system protein VirB9
VRIQALITVALAGISLVTAPGSAHAVIVPPKGSVDPRVRVVAYDPNDVVKLQGYVGYQIHLQWAEGEEFVSLGSGDAGGFDIGSEKNHFFIKPRQERVGTNLTVLTNRRAYEFDYSVAKAPVGAMALRNMVYSVHFVYPQDDARRDATELARQKTERRFNKAASERPHNDDYWFCGSPSLKPISAYDDGVHTHLRFASRGDFPAIFIRNEDDSESLINFNVDRDDVVLHRVARRFVLRRGQLVGCVTNHAFEGGGQRLDNNTVVSDVERQTKGVAP